MSEDTTKKEPGMAQLVLVLFAISAITALLLGLVNMVTAPVIAANEEAKKNAAMAAVLPYDGEYVPMEYNGTDTTVGGIYQAGDSGYVVEVAPIGSFSGTFTVMVGVDANLACTGVEVVKTAETSGLGSLVTKPVFKDQFTGVTGAVAVTKDGGTINSVTGATITSRCMANGVTSAIAAAAEMG